MHIGAIDDTIAEALTYMTCTAAHRLFPQESLKT
jgi:hypothetical protein